MQLKISQDVVPGTIVLSDKDGGSVALHPPVVTGTFGETVGKFMRSLNEPERSKIVFLLVAQENYDEVKACL